MNTNASFRNSYCKIDRSPPSVQIEHRMTKPDALREWDRRLLEFCKDSPNFWPLGYVMFGRRSRDE